MVSRASVSADWLRKGLMVDDLTILRNLLADSSTYDIRTAQLEKSLFEKTYNLKSISTDSYSSEEVKHALGQEIMTQEVRKNKQDLKVEGVLLPDQVASLLPINLTPSESTSLSYTLSRIIMEDVPSDLHWTFNPTGLDPLSSALLSLYSLSRLSDDKLDWLLSIWSWKANELKVELLKLILDFVNLSRKRKQKKQREEHVESVEEEIFNRLKALSILTNTPVIEIEETDLNLDAIIVQSIKCLESSLHEDQFRIKDPLSEIIERWGRFENETTPRLRSGIVSAKKALMKLREQKDSYSNKEFKEEANRLRRVIKGNQKEMLEHYRQLKDELRSFRTHKNEITEWTYQSLHADGFAPSRYQYVLKNLRSGLNILKYSPLFKMCSYLSKNEQPGHPTATDIVKHMGLKKGMAHYIRRRLELLLHEHYFLSPANIDLRYRFIFTEKQRSGVTSDGSFERMHLSGSEIYEGSLAHSGCTVHLEPRNSQGPSESQIPLKSFQITVDSELISMKLDLFDLKDEKWIVKPWQSASQRRSSKWLFRETRPQSMRTLPTPTEIDILGPTLYLQCLRPNRRWFFEKSGMNYQTARQYLTNMIRKEIFGLLYLPALIYCGLPLGLIIGGHFKSTASRSSFIKQITSTLPFARILTDESTNLVGYLRIPVEKRTAVRSNLGTQLSETTDHSFISGIVSQQSYLLTTFHRLYRPSDNEWNDPWSN